MAALRSPHREGAGRQVAQMHSYQGAEMYVWGLSSELTSFPNCPWTWSSHQHPGVSKDRSTPRSQTFLRAATAQAGPPCRACIHAAPRRAWRCSAASSGQLCPSQQAPEPQLPVCKTGDQQCRCQPRIPSQRSSAHEMSKHEKRQARDRNASAILSSAVLFVHFLSCLDCSLGLSFQRSPKVNRSTQGSAGHVPALQESPGVYRAEPSCDHCTFTHTVTCPLVPERPAVWAPLAFEMEGPAQRGSDAPTTRPRGSLGS